MSITVYCRTLSGRIYASAAFQTIGMKDEVTKQAIDAVIAHAWYCQSETCACRVLTVTHTPAPAPAPSAGFRDPRVLTFLALAVASYLPLVFSPLASAWGM